MEAHTIVSRDENLGYEVTQDNSGFWLRVPRTYRNGKTLWVSEALCGNLTSLELAIEHYLEFGAHVETYRGHQWTERQIERLNSHR